ncbi:response regulator transcription factor [Paenibacillus cymbidii]|uniref:response regulator transcription factor n=1 Tax=Paenibacillus cymbidii TaxID=1639034 RepID=UPI00108047F2|nr:response regulator transcription factor [Paenibacillus cymbidii]
MRILFAEDDESLGELTEHQLQRRYHSVDWVRDGAEAKTCMQAGAYDVYVFDWMLPDSSGIELTANARAAGDKTPILLLTARDAVQDRVLGLRTGADDYMIKPFALDELDARIHALARRGDSVYRPDQLQVGELSANPARYEVTRGGVPVALTRREFQLLVCLMRHAGQVLSREQLLDHVWGIGAGVTLNTVDATVKLLRKKVDGPFAAKLIRSIYGAGYRLAVPNGEKAHV